MTSPVWTKGPVCPVLAAGEIHLWLASIEEVWPSIRPEELAESEQNRLEKLSNESVKKQFGVSSWLTRQLLSRYLSTPPRDLVFGLSEHGKPFLVHAEGTLRKVEFNRSHSGGWILLAISGDAAVGVDLECKTRPVEMQMIVDRWFEPREKDCFSKLADHEKTTYFYDCWTRKEAVLKAWGVGISHLSEYAAYERKTWHKNLAIASALVACVAATTDPTQDLKIVAYEVG